MADGEEQRKNGGENPLLNQIRNRTYSLHHQQFAEIYIEEKHPAPRESSVSGCLVGLSLGIVDVSDSP